jgi:hypothetical protein
MKIPLLAILLCTVAFTISLGAVEYFPPDISMSEYYVSILSAGHEPPLATLNEMNRETYRFLWFPSFDPALVIRAERRGGSYHLIVRQISVSFNPDTHKMTSKLEREIDKTLVKEQWEGLVAAIKRADYWKLPSSSPPYGKDGASWVLEGMKRGQYHIVDRWSPRDGAYRDACLYMLALAGIPVGKAY